MLGQKILAGLILRRQDLIPRRQVIQPAWICQVQVKLAMVWGIIKFPVGQKP